MPTSRRPPLDDPPAPAGGRRLRDQAARDAATDPRRNVVLEASAGTGKTRVLVDRYVNLLEAGVEPQHILAITFTRKAAAEMRDRIVRRLREAAALSADGRARWETLRDRLGEIAISTIDAFCLALLREFPLEAGVDPGFDVADETALPRLIDESLDRAMRICRGLARDDETVALLFAQLGESRLRAGLAALLGRRHVAQQALDWALAPGPRDLTVDEACRRGVDRLAGALKSIPGGIDAFLAIGPAGHPAFDLLARDVRALVASAAPGGAPYTPGALRGLIARLDEYFFTEKHTPRKRTPGEYTPFHASKQQQRDHWTLVHDCAPSIGDAALALRRDLNVVLARGVRRAFAVAVSEFRRTLDRHGVLDFTELLGRAVALLGNMEEFARSRYLLEARYHHVLVDEFQDTSRAQWALIGELVRAWGEGAGPAHEHIPPSIFIVGDRKQSIYGFRDADVSLLTEAAAAIAALRERDDPVFTIAHSFRSVPPLLAFANDIFEAVEKAPHRADAFRYDERDRFPLDDSDALDEEGAEDLALGIAAGASPEECAELVAAEVARLLQEVILRDRDTGLRRPARPGDIAILFRSRETHRAFERALEARRIPAYVYKGLGFFEADEVQDLIVLLRYLADPCSNLRAAALLRSRFIRLSDPALAALAPGLAAALADATPPAALAHLDDEDRGVLARARESIGAWLRLADRVPPAELLDRILEETAYAVEWRGPRLAQARENVKKLRAMVRRIQNRGYVTLARLADHLDRMSTGDESNAVIDAIDAVNLMTVHAAKGLEFPVVFVVGLERGAGGAADPIRISMQNGADDAVAVGDFRTETDEDAPDRNVEETKRLLYVAVTRARDRLYLSASVPSGSATMRRGGLGAVLPESFRAVFARAAGSAAREVEWVGPGGRVHRLAVCRMPSDAPDAAGVAALPAAQGAPSGLASRADARAAESEGGLRPQAPGSVAGAPPPDAVDDFAPLSDAGGTVRVAVTALQPAGEAPAPRERAADVDQPIAGRLVHRLFERGGGVELDEAALRERAARLLGDDERESLGDPDRVVALAASAYAALRARPDVRTLLDDATCLYEVPFSVRADAGPAIAAATGGEASIVVRGAIDCLALRPSGEVIVVDFKTGAPRAADRDQLAIYLDAARALFPGRPVEGRLIYARSRSR